MSNEIRGFFGEYRFLSNFWHSPMLVENLVFPTGEHYYQALKCVTIEEALQIQSAETPRDAKKLGRTVTVRPDWDDVKVQAMRVVTYTKYIQNPHLMDKLLDTQDKLLVESNTWHDNFWGECTCSKCEGVEKLNHLGKTLMLIRDTRADGEEFLLL